MNNQTSIAAAEMADAKFVHAYLRALAGRSGTTAAGPFVILFGADPDPFGNYAIPQDGAEPTAAHVAELAAVFRARNRRPRLEYVPAAAPAVEAALMAAGFTVELRPPLLTRRPRVTAPVPDLDGVELFAPTTEDELRQAVAVQRMAFGQSETVSDGQVRSRLRFLAAGGRLAAARDRARGTVVGAGAHMPLIEGVTEIVGIGVRPAFRRRGIGEAITRLLAAEAFAAGAELAFLSAANDAACRIYEQAGFVRRMPMLHISLG
jgi:ribosomal protein S18 acetylase RimI-like enzyme